MNRLLLIALLFVFVWYLWWRVRRRFAGLVSRYRRQKPRAEQKKTTALTLEKDPVTGVYRPPEG